MSKSVKWLWLCLPALLVGFAAAFYFARPLFALNHLKAALEARDEAAVSRYVDFDELRKNVTQYVTHKIDESNEDKFLGDLRSAIVGKIAEFKIESLATPEGLIHLACDISEDGDVDTSPKPEGTPCHVDADMDEMDYLSATRFKVMAHRKQGGDMGMILDQGEDGQWRLVGLTGSGPVKK